MLRADYRREPSGRWSRRGSFFHLGLRVRHAAAAIAILLLSACADNPPPPSADTSCERFRHISANAAQIKVFSDNWEVMESYADQAVAHNLAYDEHCLPKEKK